MVVMSIALMCTGPQRDGYAGDAGGDDADDDDEDADDDDDDDGEYDDVAVTACVAAQGMRSVAAPPHF